MIRMLNIDLPLKNQESIELLDIIEELEKLHLTSNTIIRQLVLKLLIDKVKYYLLIFSCFGSNGHLGWSWSCCS